MRSLVLLALAAAAPTAVADNFDYELRGGFSRDTATARTSLGNLETESDQLDATFLWYFKGLSDQDAPRARAEFANRASFLSLSANTGSSDASGSLVSSSSDFDTSGIAIGGRYVFLDSDWFFEADASFLETDVLGGETEIDQLGLTLGRYIGAMTSLQLTLGRLEADSDLGSSNTDTGISATLRHIGDAYGDWQYGLDLTLGSTTVADADGTFGIDVSLFPNRDMTLALGINGQFGANDGDSTTYALRGGYFFAPNFEMQLGFRFTNVDEPTGIDFDDDGFFIGGRYRF